MINIYLDPVILRSGPITIGWHGFFLVAAVVVALWIDVRLGRARGINGDQILELAVWAVVPAYVAMRLPLVLERPAEFAGQPLRVFAFWEGGAMIYTALVAIFAVAAFYSHRRGIPFGDLADVLIMAIPVADFLGRIGCTLNGDTAGIPTGGQWGLVYWHPNAQVPRAWLGVPTWPVPTIIQAWSLATLAVLWLVWRRSPSRGTVALVGLFLIAAGYFVAGFWRPEVVFLFGLRQRQIASLLAMAAAAVLLLWRRVRRTGVT
jgi:phosphatidylglycerol---prolipoprotein diacylglyceryl transferase